LIPGSGWYTKLLTAVLKEKSKLYEAYGTGRIVSCLLKDNPEFTGINVVAKVSKLYRKDGVKFYSLENADMGLTKMDVVLTFRNYHDFDFQGQKAMNETTFKALKWVVSMVW
jgi:predicted methyltransferase